MGSVELAEEAGISESGGLVVQLEGVSISQIQLSFLKIALPEIKPGLITKHLSISLVHLDLLLEIPFSLGRIILQELLFIG